ncbi:MAG TPA: hypothetical protein VFA23_10715 [Dongiaceae bacterium]|nr:hypothetical protein [Dongiaceae bacterium]
MRALRLILSVAVLAGALAGCVSYERDYRYRQPYYYGNGYSNGYYSNGYNGYNGYYYNRHSCWNCYP